jgi:signal transduction histidine kinase
MITIAHDMLYPQAPQIARSRTTIWRGIYAFLLLVGIGLAIPQSLWAQGKRLNLMDLWQQGQISDGAPTAYANGRWHHLFDGSRTTGLTGKRNALTITINFKQPINLSKVKMLQTFGRAKWHIEGGTTGGGTGLSNYRKVANTDSRDHYAKEGEFDSLVIRPTFSLDQLSITVTNIKNGTATLEEIELYIDADSPVASASSQPESATAKSDTAADPQAAASVRKLTQSKAEVAAELLARSDLHQLFFAEKLKADASFNDKQNLLDTLNDQLIASLQQKNHGEALDYFDIYKEMAKLLEKERLIAQENLNRAELLNAKLSLEERHHRIQLVLGLLAFLALGAAIVVLWRQKRDRDKANQELARKNVQIRQQNEALGEANQAIQAHSQLMENANKEVQAANKELQVALNQVKAKSQEVERQRSELELANQRLHSAIDEVNVKNDLLEERNHQLSRLNNSLDESNVELKTAQAEKLQAQRMAALSEITPILAHEINTPLTAIRGSVGQLSGNIELALTRFPVLMAALSPAGKELFHQLMERQRSGPDSVQGALTTKEERQHIHRLEHELEQLAEYHALDPALDPDELAPQLVKLGLLKDYAPYLPLFAECAQNGFSLNDFQRIVGVFRQLNLVQNASDRIQGMVHYISNVFSQNAQNQVLASIDVVESFELVLKLYDYYLKQGIEIHKDFQPAKPIEITTYAIKQVWSNLIMSAYHAMNGQGSLWIHVAGLRDSVFIRIQDSAPVMDDETLRTLFDKSNPNPRQTEPPINLAVCRSFVEEQGGNIAAMVENGRNTITVRFRINE